MAVFLFLFTFSSGIKRSPNKRLLSPSMSNPSIVCSYTLIRLQHFSFEIVILLWETWKLTLWNANSNQQCLIWFLLTNLKAHICKIAIILFDGKYSLWWLQIISLVKINASNHFKSTEVTLCLHNIKGIIM